VDGHGQENAVGSEAHERRRPRQPRLAVTVSVAVSLLLALGICLVLGCLLYWQPLPLRLRWFSMLPLGMLVLLGTAMAVRLSWRLSGRWLRWLLCVPPLLLCAVLLFALVGAYAPWPGTQRFILQCATVKRGETVDEFEKRMIGWGRPRPLKYDDPQDPRKRIAVFGTGDTGADAFVVYYDRGSSRIESWRFEYD
jgi:hypothetical protein